VVIENRHGLAVDGGCARNGRAASDDSADNPGGNKAYDTGDVVVALHLPQVTPRVAQNASNRNRSPHHVSRRL